MGTPVPLEPNAVKFIKSHSIKATGNGVPAARKLLIFSQPKVGKTVLGARLGKHNWLVTDEDGFTSLTNDSVRKVIGHWDGTTFEKWVDVRMVLQAAEAGQIICECGEPVDNIILDTVSGMVAETLQQIAAGAGTPKTGRVAPESAGRPDYMVSKDRILPVMQQIAQMRNCSVTLLAHTKGGTKDAPNVVPDIHGAAYEVVNKYISLQAYMFIDDGTRKLQVGAMGNQIVTGSRYDFPANIVTDDEFVAHVEKWKEAT